MRKSLLTESSTAWARKVTVAAYPPRSAGSLGHLLQSGGHRLVRPGCGQAQMPGDSVRFLALIGEGPMDQTPLREGSELIGDRAHEGVTEGDLGGEGHQVPQLPSSPVGIDAQLRGGAPQGRLGGAGLGGRQGQEGAAVLRVGAGALDE